MESHETPRIRLQDKFAAANHSFEIRRKFNDGIWKSDMVLPFRPILNSSGSTILYNPCGMASNVFVRYHCTTQDILIHEWMKQIKHLVQSNYIFK